MGFRDLTTWKAQPIIINYIPIGRTHRDLSNEMCFIFGTLCRINPYMKY